MMDPKRNSVVGRVATPKSAAGGLGSPQGMTELDAALSRAVGGRIRITTSVQGSAPLEGILFTACPITNILALNTSQNTTQGAAGDFHLIPVSQVANFQILSTPAGDGAVSPPNGGFAEVVPSISRLDMDAFRAREEDAIRKLKEYEGTRGKGVTKEAQEIFDWFRRTLPVRWNGEQIIVNDAVIVNPPYSIDDLKAPKDKQNALAQIKRVLEGYYSKKKNGSTSNANSGTNTPVGGGANRPVVPALPRKGG